MIFDIKDAFLIVFAVLIVAFFITEFVLLLREKFSSKTCDHCFAEFQSTGTRKCIDCGFEETIKKPHYPKHQR